MNSKVLIRKSPIYSKCPSCSQYDVLRRSTSRTFIEQVVNHSTFYRIYRCKSCGWRGYLSTITVTIKSVKTLLLYLFLGVATAFIVREILRRFV